MKRTLEVFGWATLRGRPNLRSAFSSIIITGAFNSQISTRQWCADCSIYLLKHCSWKTACLSYHKAWWPHRTQKLPTHSLFPDHVQSHGTTVSKLPMSQLRRQASTSGQSFRLRWNNSIDNLPVYVSNIKSSVVNNHSGLHLAFLDISAKKLKLNDSSFDIQRHHPLPFKSVADSPNKRRRDKGRRCQVVTVKPFENVLESTDIDRY